MVAFYAILLFVLCGMQAVMGAWFVTVWPQLSGRWFILWGPLLLSVLTLVAMAYSRVHYQGLGQAAYYGAYVWFGFVFLGFCWCALCALFYRVLGWTHLPQTWLGFFSLAGLVVIWAMALWGGFSEPKIKKISVQIPNMPKLKIALLSDSHLGMGVSLARFERALQKIEQENPDVLFSLGDIFEYGPNPEKYAARLKQVKTPLGTYGVLGNHEYYVGYQNSKKFLKDAGVVLLENTSVLLPNGVQVAGVKDIHTAHVRPEEVTQLLASLPRENPTIFLSHTPKYAEIASRAGADLMFSGHTHNGQLWPFNYLVRLQFPRVYGLFDVEGMQFYITSGLFYWGIPLRFLAPAEIPIIEVN